jgi:hypothetical protein
MELTKTLHFLHQRKVIVNYIGLQLAVNWYITREDTHLFYYLDKRLVKMVV